MHRLRSEKYNEVNTKISNLYDDEMYILKQITSNSEEMYSFDATTPERSPSQSEDRNEDLASS